MKYQHLQSRCIHVKYQGIGVVRREVCVYLTKATNAANASTMMMAAHSGNTIHSGNAPWATDVTVLGTALTVAVSSAPFCTSGPLVAVDRIVE